ncbi:MAG: hypothetical protein CUN57_03190, partial [Phototrophicales bacterium]
MQTMDWNYNGSLITSHCKDKKLRVIDPRQKKIAQETAGHTGVKGARAVWATEDVIITAGFQRGSGRQYKIWDLKNFSKPIVDENIDYSSGIMMPFYDHDTNILFLAG